MIEMAHNHDAFVLQSTESGQMMACSRDELIQFFNALLNGDFNELLKVPAAEDNRCGYCGNVITRLPGEPWMHVHPTDHDPSPANLSAVEPTTNRCSHCGEGIIHYRGLGWKHAIDKPDHEATPRNLSSAPTPRAAGV